MRANGKPKKDYLKDFHRFIHGVTRYLKKKYDQPKDLTIGFHSFKLLNFEDCQMVKNAVENNWRLIVDYYSDWENVQLNIIGLDTTVVHILDVDNARVLEQYNIFKVLRGLNCPYYLSINKKLPKFLLIIKNMPPNHLNNIKLIKDELELQCGQWSYISTDTHIVNTDCDIPEIEYEDLMEEFVKQPQPPKVQRIVRSNDSSSSSSSVSLPEGVSMESFLQHTIQCIHPERADVYDEWRNVGFAIRAWDTTEEVGFKVFQQFSKKSTKYTETSYDENLRVWHSFGNHCDRQTLLRYATSDNYDDVIQKVSFFRQFDETEIFASTDNDSYYRVKEEFEKNHFKLQHPLQYCSLSGEHLNKVLHYSPNEFKQLYINHYYTKYDEKKKTEVKRVFVDQWMKDSNIVTYSRLGFNPEEGQSYQETGSEYPVFNIFRGLNYTIITPPNEEDVNWDTVDKVVDIYFKIIRNLVNRDEEAYKYVLNYFAHLVQKPGEKTKVCILFKTPQGFGKNTLCDIFGDRILGHYLFCTDPDLIFGTYNGSLKNRLFIVLNEASGNKTMKHNERFKALITDDTFEVNQKYISPHTYDNHSNIVVFTNNFNAVKIEESDRRFVAFESSKTEISSEEYALVNTILRSKTPEGNAGILKIVERLKQRDITNFNLQKQRPITNLYKDMKQTSYVVKFFHHYFFEKFPSVVGFIKSPTETYAEYREYMMQSGCEVCTSNRFFQETNSYSRKNDGFIDINKSNGVRRYTIEREHIVSYLEKKHPDMIGDD